MIGGLVKSTSRLALIAAAGLMVGGIAMPSAKAADLGGDCCADLEERVAELEATTARKGNRRMSLTITGQVNRTMLWFNDGHLSNTYYGLDSTISSSRFSFLGSARISPKIQAGFDITIEIEAGGTSSKVHQFDEDGKIATSAPLGTSISFNSPTVDSYFGDARRVAVWIEHADLGRITLGRHEGAGHPYTIDLGGIGVVGGGSKATFGGGALFLRDSVGSYYNINVAALTDPAGTTNGVLGRQEVLRYDSPTFFENFLGAKGGFIATGSIAEAGDSWGAMLRYAGEFCPGACATRVAAQIGLDRSRDRLTPAIIDPVFVAAADLAGPAPDTQTWGAALSLFHVHSGLFVQGHYFRTQYGSPNRAHGYMGAQSTSATNPQQPDGVDWMLQAGITKNWLGIGNTSLYAEYGESHDWGAMGWEGRDFPGTTSAGTPPFVGFTISGMSAIGDVTDTKVAIAGVGLVQNVDSAAMELYIGYRRYESELSGIRANTTFTAVTAQGVAAGQPPFATTTANVTTNGVTPAATNVAGALRQTFEFEDIHIIHAGARIKF